MASVDTVLRLVRPFIRNCPDVVMRDWVIEAARDFCRDSRWLRQSVTVPVLESIDTYGLATTVTDAEVTGIYSAQYAGRPLKPGSPEEYPSVVSCPVAYWFLPSKKIVLAGAPSLDSSDDLVVSLLLQPVLNATTFPDELLLRYDKTIAHGAIWRLASMPGAGWSNPQLAAERMQLERMGMVDARVEADMQHRHFDYDTLPGF